MKYKSIYLVIIGLLLMVLSFLLNIYGSNAINRINENYVDFTTVTKENTNSYLYLDLVSQYKNNTYIVYKGDNLYVLKSKVNFSKEEFDGKTIRVLGTSKEFDDYTKNDVLNLFNSKYTESEESKILIDEFNDYFYNYYLEVDEVVDDNMVGRMHKDTSTLLYELGIVCLSVFVIFLLIEVKTKQSN